MSKDDKIPRAFLMFLSAVLFGLFGLYPGFYVIPFPPIGRMFVGSSLGVIIMFAILNIGDWMDRRKESLKGDTERTMI